MTIFDWLIQELFVLKYNAILRSQLNHLNDVSICCLSISDKFNMLAFFWHNLKDNFYGKSLAIVHEVREVDEITSPFKTPKISKESFESFQYQM